MVDFRKKQTEERRGSMRDRARKRAEERESQGGGTKYNLPDGVSFFSPSKRASLDIIPYTVSVEHHPEDVPKGELWYQRTVLVHYNVGSENKSYLCPRTVKKKCPICEYRAQLMKDSDANEDAIKSLKARERELFNVYDREEPDKGVQFWDISNFNFGAKLEEELREGRAEWAGFAEPVDGFTLKVRFTEEQIGKNKFMQASRIDFEERKSIEKKLLDKALDLDKILKVLSYEQLEKVFLEVEEEEPVDDKEPPQEGVTGGSVDGDEEHDSPPRGRGVRETEPSTTTRRQRAESTPEERSEAPRSRDREKERTRPAKAKAVDAPVCPAGGTFGKDCDELEECKDCSIWEKCIEEQERMAAK